MNLFCWIPVEHDATSFYRALQPISQLRKIYPNLNIFHAPKEINMIHFAHMDVVFMQRPSSLGNLAVMDMCKNLKIKVWVDYDDNLFCIPGSNPASSSHDEKSRKVIQDILNAADIISVSTEKLALDLSKYLRVTSGEKRIHIIPNAFNDYLFTEKPVFRPHNVVMWRGSQSHQGDMMTFAPYLVKAAKSNPEWFFNFIGYNPFYITEKLGRQGAHTDGLEIFKYHELIRRIYPNLCIVTLTDSDFNRCKSNIAWIEATYAGAVTLAPNFDEWKKPGITTYHDIPDFGYSLKELLKTDVQVDPILQKCHKLSWEYIGDKLRLSQVNKQRIRLLEEVMSS